MGEILKDIKNSNIITEGLFLMLMLDLTPINSGIIVLAMMYLLILTSLRETEKYRKESIFLITLYIKEDFLLKVQNAGIDDFKALLVRFHTKDLHWRS